MLLTKNLRVPEKVLKLKMSYIFINSELWEQIKSYFTRGLTEFDKMILYLVRTNRSDVTNDIFIVFPSSLDETDILFFNSMEDTQLGLVRPSTFDNKYSLYIRPDYISYIS